MITARHLIREPVFVRDRLRYLRVAADQAVVLRNGDMSPVDGFVGAWQPVFVYTGLTCVYLLAFEQNGAQATWLVGLDGRRLGDKLADLDAAQRDELRAAIVARGLDKPGGLIGDGIQFIEPGLLGGLLALAPDPDLRQTGAQIGLAMLGAPRGLHSRLSFRRGDQAAVLRQGWAEPAGSGRAIGGLSVIETELVPAASRLLLSLVLAPLSAAVELEILVNDRRIAQTRLHARWQQEGAALAYWLAPELVAGRNLRIALRHSQDFILESLELAGAPERVKLAPLDPEQLMLGFENLGDNCEFGMVQRHFGADPVGLLRFAGLGHPRKLVRFLEDDFGAHGEPGSLHVQAIGGEYWIVDPVYGFASHTFRYVHDSVAEEVIRENEIKAGYLKRKLREDLEDGEKILVYKRVVTQDPAEMLALHAALNRFGAVCKLLWVTQADEAHAAGDVEWIGDRLLKGYLRAISLTDANDFDPQDWLLLCRNAHAAFHGAS